ncbi:MAG: hypothetical protein AAFQ80_19140 [Cyanobacteria bacterium J06621_8]
MSEAKKNNFFNLESLSSNSSQSLDQGIANQSENSEQEITKKYKFEESDNNSFMEQAIVPETNQVQENNQPEVGESSIPKMDWQKVAHKLREYNRRLLKKVFRLEQELAEIDNKFNRYVEKSQNSDLLLAKQAEEIKAYQDQLSVLTQELVTAQQQAARQELVIQQLSDKHELAQKQTAQLERECTLLQEKSAHQALELAVKDEESIELQNQLHQQQQTAQEKEAELKRYQSAAKSRQEKAIKQQNNYPHNRFVQPWSTNAIPEPKIAFPRNNSLAIKEKTSHSKTREASKTAAKITTWSAANGKEKKPQKSTPTKKPQSLAAVDLPTFPRPQ